ncbi:malic enzyme-like NAD(P)-binding protein [Candidatus Vidania fulgoroideorum]
MRNKSLEYHKYPKPGKISTKLKKKIRNKEELSLAYTPGVADVSKEIIKNEKNIYKYTNACNLVAVITNGTAVLGLGNIGAAPSKPVMEGKSALFKRFAGIDSVDIEINESNPHKLSEIIISLEKSFGGINLEDIKSPECFYVEKQCIKKMNIPVFHDDQHGTAVVVAAALKNSLKLVKKKIRNIKTVVLGAGAAATSCLKILRKIGIKPKKTYVFDINGLITKKRGTKNNLLRVFEKSKRICFREALNKCDFLLGLSTGGIVKGKDIKNMAREPIIFSLANPIPEILPEEVKKVRKDAIVATGRSDYPNQVNNVLCFPYIFRAALDSRIKKIDLDMKLEAINALSKLGIRNKLFSKEKILPDIFEEKLLEYIPYKIVKSIIKRKKNNINIELNKYKRFLKSIKNES